MSKSSEGAEKVNTTDTKKCSRCREDKPVTAFWKMSKSKDGLHSFCRACDNAARKDRRHGVFLSKNALNIFSHCFTCGLWMLRSEFYPLKNGRVTGECRICFKERQNKRFHNPEKKPGILKQMREQRLGVRMEMIYAYGGKCQCCSESRWEFLTIDHIDGGGKKHNQQAGGSAAVLRGLKKLAGRKKAIGFCATTAIADGDGLRTANVRILSRLLAFLQSHVQTIMLRRSNDVQSAALRSCELNSIAHAERLAPIAGLATQSKSESTGLLWQKAKNFRED